MARLESQSKMGFYPTPPKALEWLCQAVTASGDGIHILDPCCGKGMALSNIGNKLNAATYGIELDRRRFEESAAILNNTLHCSSFEAVVSKESMGLLYLNPPYDWDLRVEDRPRRMEASFYYATIDMLAPGGWLIFLVPDNIFDDGLLKSLAYRLEDIEVFKFPRFEYPIFSQIALIGRKRVKGVHDSDSARRLVQMIKQAPCMDDVNIENKYVIPSTSAARLFRDNIPTAEEMVKELATSPLWKELQELVVLPEPVSAIRPMMPLKKGHIAALLTAGVMNGVVEKDGIPIVVKGFTQRAEEAKEEMDEDGRIKIITRYFTKVQVRYFTQEGGIANVT